MDLFQCIEELSAYIKLQFSTANNLESAIYKVIMAYKNKLQPDSVALFIETEGRLDSLEKFHLYEDSFYFNWQSVKTKFLGLLDDKKNNSFEFSTSHYTVYCYPIKTYGWLLLSKKVPFATIFLSKLEELVSNFERMNQATSSIEVLSEKNKKPSSGDFEFLFKDIIENSSESILISDLEGNLCYANQKSREWLGILETDYRRIKVYDYEKYFEGDKINNWINHVKEMKKVGQLQSRGNLNNFKTGDAIATDATISYQNFNGHEFILAVSKDISNRKEFEAIISKESQLHEILLEMASQYINIDITEIDNLINSSLQQIGEFVNADRAYIFEYDFLTETTSNTHEWCEEGIQPEIQNLQDVPISAMPEWLARHRKGLSFIIHDVSKLPDTGPTGIKSILEPQGVKSLITIPMLNKGKLLGFVGFDAVKTKKKYSIREENLLLVYSEILVNMNLRQQYESELIQQKDRFRTIITNIDLGLIEVNMVFEITFVSESFMNFYGYKYEELLGKNVLDIFLSKNDAIGLKKKMRQMNNKEVLTIELKTYAKNGEVKEILSSIIKRKENNSIDYLGTIFDRSAQKQLEKELIEVLKRKEEASRAKEQFFANMSHELRTPLNIINGSITEINKQKISNDARFFLDQASIASTHMLNLVNNVLDFAKINLGEIKMDYKEFNLIKTIKDTFNIFNLMASEKLIAYTLVIDDTTHSHVLGDYSKLNQVLINLIGNAIKFTELGQVNLNVAVFENKSESQIIEFTISDSGIGMSEDFLLRIFEEYQQDILINSLQSGTGLGMPISKKLIAVMGGEINVSSKKNSGTTISFKVPFEKRVAPEYSVGIIGDKKLLNGKNILIAEDNYMNALILERKLKDIGATVTKVENGELAIEALKNGHFDLVFMDIQMPVLDGLQATRVIREDLFLDIPIIAVTANVFKDNFASYIASGINDVILKPFEDQLLYRKIISTIKFNNIILNKENTSTQKITMSQKKAYSLEKLKNISKNDQDFYQEMIEVFIKLTNTSIADLENAIATKNMEDVAKIIHRIKPSVTDLAIWDATALIRVLEDSEYTNLTFVMAYTNALVKILKKVTATILSEEL